MTTDLIEKTYWASADLLSLGTQIQRVMDLPPPEELQRRIGEMFDRMSQKCRELGILEEDATEARYAICAFIDEMVLNSPWPGRTYWMNRPLQLAYFNENTAGEGFFTHLDNLRRQRRPNVVAIYYACLQLGFRGKYAVTRGVELQQLADVLAAELGRELPSADLLAPHGEPKDIGRRFGGPEAPVAWIGLAIFAFAILVVIGLKLTLLVSTASLNSRLNAEAVTLPPAAPAATGKTP